MNIVSGSNESGKSTLFEFIYRVLFGFPKGKKKKEYNPYASVARNRTGGRLVLEDEKVGLFTIERFDGEKSGDTVLTYSDGKTGSEEELFSILGPITVDMYRDVFAFGLNELWDLQEESLKRFYGAGLGLKNVFVSDILNSLKNKSREIFKTTRGETEIRKNIAKLNHIHKEIHTLFNQKQLYDDISFDLKKIEQELTSSQKTHAALQSQYEHNTMLKKAWPFWVELIESEKELTALPFFSDFPQQALVRMEKTLERSKEWEIRERAAKEELARVEAGYNELRGKLAGVLPDLKQYSPESLLDLLEEYQKQISLITVLLSSLKDKNHRMETFEERRISLQSQLTMAQMTRTPTLHTAYLPGLAAPFVLALTGIIFTIQGFGFLWPGLIITLAIALSLVHIVSTHRKLKCVQEGENLFEPLRKEIESCDLTLKSLKNEIKNDEIEIADHAKKIGLSSLPTVEELENKRVVINRMGLQLRDFKKEKDTIDSSLSDIHIKKEDAQKELEQLLIAAHARDLETFRIHAGQMEKRARLEETIKSSQKNLLILGCKDLSRLKDELEITSIEGIVKKIPEIQTQTQNRLKIMEDLRQKKGELLEQRRKLEMDRIPELRLEQEQTLAKLDSLGRKWCVYRLAEILLQKAREKYEREKQPRVLSEAGLFFKKMTAEKYQRIGFSSEEKAFLVFDSYNKIKDPVFLSRGTREQMYLAIRFGLIKSFELNGMILPVMTDDILVNFDPERARGAADAFCELAKTHQAIFFTCHPETVEIFKALNSESPIHTL